MMKLRPTEEEGTDPDRDPRDSRALTQYLTVLDDTGRAAGDPDLYLVVSQSGREYLVDARTGACECADHEYRDIHCKHARRVEFATGEREIPDWIPEDDVDPLLGEHVQTKGRTDGGHPPATPSNPDGQDAQDDLELVDTGAGSLVFEQLTEERDGATVTTGKRLIGYYRVDDWGAIEDAIRARGYGAGDIHLPEFETTAEARDAAQEAGA